jgi:predicted ATPase
LQFQQFTRTDPERTARQKREHAMSDRAKRSSGTGGRRTTRAGAAAARAATAQEAAARAREAERVVRPRLLSVTHMHPDWADVARFPFSVPAIRDLQTLDLDAPVTCFVGENGSGKSTLLEALAIKVNLPAAGRLDRPAQDDSLAEQRWLAQALRLAWTVRTTRGFFLRAEDFFAWQLQVKRDRAALEARLVAIDEELADATPHARELAKGPIRASLFELTERYGADPDARSHGEGFIHFFQQRFVPGGLFLLDEPEAALSPQRQLALVALILEAIDEGAQFIIATHAPILLAIPGARIWSFDDGAPTEIAWDATEHVRLTRDFLAAPSRFLDRLR